MTQGPFLRVLDATTHMVTATIDMESELALGVMESLALKGVAAARVQTFTSGTEAFLYIAANRDFGGGDVRPYYLVLDQEVLVTTGTGAVVQHGELSITGAEALDVSVNSAPHPVVAGAFQSAWFTARNTASSEIHARLLFVDSIGATWNVDDDLFTFTATSPPDPLTIGTSPAAELSVMPLASIGDLADLAFDGADNPAPQQFCQNLTGVQQAVEVNGPFSGGYTIFAVDNLNDQVNVIQETDIDVGGMTCATTQVAVGIDPVAIDSIGQEFTTKIFVANQGSNDVSQFVNPADNPEISLLGGTGPRDIAVQTTASTSCSVENVQIVSGTVSWDTAGCDPSEIFFVWCQCNEAIPEDCPQDCPATPTMLRNPEEIGEDEWDPLGITGETSFETSAGGAVSHGVSTNERAPLDVE